MDTWSRQCSSRTQIPRGRYPECSDGSLLRGKLSVGEYVKFSHRFERLVHIELADLSTNEQYLEQEWHRPTGLTSAVGTAVSPTGKGKNKVLERMMREECEDCELIFHYDFFWICVNVEFRWQGSQRDLHIQKDDGRVRESRVPAGGVACHSQMGHLCRVVSLNANRAGL